ncbi:MAG: hypothetical protein COT74_07320 [Bdellovibrionales bacterium CG10_big_fil_rev_8_21_14_0_10_45_34]|nr:MAG: hypothetical protein COT74_07320 [Bdellovibrionales bacterium CG10_big_fil_rev_8_21_14_0_10_45_34]
MPKIELKESTNLKASEAFSKIRGVLESDPDLKKLDSTYQCRFDEAALSGVAEGKKFKAKLSVSEGGPSTQILLLVDLPLLFAPFKSLVESTLKKKLAKALS